MAKHPKLHFGEITDNLSTTIARNDELFTELRKCLGLTARQFEFFLNNVEGKRKEEFTTFDEGDTCSYCESGLIINGTCQKCGL